jgi:hypothetical protein
MVCSLNTLSCTNALQLQSFALMCLEAFFVGWGEETTHGRAKSWWKDQVRLQALIQFLSVPHNHHDPIIVKLQDTWLEMV